MAPSRSDSFNEFIEMVRADRSGKVFERACQWMLRYVDPWASQLHEVWRWNEWPGQWGPEHGIDLVAETRSGELWAIQAKAYGKNTRITKRHLDSFVAESAGREPDGRPEFAHRMLIATTNKMDGSATRLCQRQGISTLMLRQLERLDADWPTDELMLPSQPSAEQPRTHQNDAIGDVLAALRDKRLERGQVVMACGTGKTLVALRVAEALPSNKTLVVVPTLGLLSQTLKYWTRNRRRPFTFEARAVCADQTAARTDELPVEYVTDLGYPATTDPETIAAALTDESPTVVFSTYQSLKSIVVACRRADVQFDLLIADEAHRCAGPQKGLYGLVLDADKIPARRRLFLTATPRHYTAVAKNRARDAGASVDSMDDPTRFGPVVHRLGFRSAIEKGLICDYRIVVIQCRHEALEHVKQRRLLARDGSANVDAETLATQVVTLKAMRDYNLQRVITFHETIDKAASFAADLQDVATWMPPNDRLEAAVRAEHISGRMLTAERDERLNRFSTADRGTRRVLSNAQCLCEGIDVPAADTVVFADPGHSQIDMVQAVSRGLRKSPGKQLGTIIIPLIVPEGAPARDALDPSAFKAVVQVVEALREHDDRAEKVSELRTALGPRRLALAARTQTATIIVDSPLAVEPEYARNFNALLREGVERADRRAGNRLSRAQGESGAVQARTSDGSGETTPDWSAPETLREGLAVLAGHARGEVVGDVGSLRYLRFPLDRWWAGTLHVWENGKLDDAAAEKREISNLVSWLTVDPDTHPGVRAEMAKLTQHPVPTVVEAWLEHAQFGLSDELADFRRRGAAPNSLTIADIYQLLTRPDDPSERQAQITLSAMHVVGPVMPWGRSAAAQFRAGFLEGARSHSHELDVPLLSAHPADVGRRVGRQFAHLAQRPVPINTTKPPKRRRSRPGTRSDAA